MQNDLQWRFLPWLLAIVLIVVFGPWLRAQQAASEAIPPQQTTAFVGVQVIPMHEPGVRAGQTVLVDQGRIVAIGARDQVEVPTGFTVVDADGLYLMPGLAEMHGHLPSAQWPAGMMEATLFLYLANGVTTVRGMLGEPRQLEIRDSLSRGELLGPELFVGSPPMTGSSILSAESAEKVVRKYHSDGYDHLKVHEGLKPEVYQAIAKTATELDLDFGGHVSDLVGLEQALQAGQATVDHLDNYVASLVPGSVGQSIGPQQIQQQAEAERIPELVRMTKVSGAAVVPTMALWRTIYGGVPGDDIRSTQPELKYMPPALIQQWVNAVNNISQNFGGGVTERMLALREEVLKALNEGGATILLGTDSPQFFSVPGFSIHREMEAMAVCGMSPAQILHAGTLAVADFYQRREEHGSIQVGRQADLILLSENPLEKIQATRSIQGVMVDGRWLSREYLDARLTAIAERFGG